MPFVVVHTLLPHVILGVDFIEATNLVIHSQSGKMQFFVKRSITGKSPCSDSEFEESVKKGERPPYRMRHATQAEKKYLSEGTNAYIRRRTPAERASYTEANLKAECRQQPKHPNEPIRTALKSAQPHVRANKQLKKFEEMVRNSELLPKERQRTMPANYNQIARPGYADRIDDTWYDEGTWCSTEYERMERRARDEEEMNRVWSRRKPVNLCDPERLADEPSRDYTKTRQRIIGPKPTNASSRKPTQIPAYMDMKVTLATYDRLRGLKYVHSSQDAIDMRLIVVPGIVEIKSSFVEIVIRNRNAYDITVTPDMDLAVFEDIEGDLVEINPRKPSPADINCFNQRFDNIPGLAQPTINDNVFQKQVVDSVEEYMKHFNIGEQVQPEERQQLTEFLVEYRDRFVLEGDRLGQVTVEEHHINTGDNPPVNSAPYRVSAFERKAIEEQVQSMLDQGIIEPIISEWASPVVIVCKRDNSLRFCVDYRKVNKITKADRYPLPRLDDALDVLGKNDLYSTLDACSAYWQIRMAPDSVEKTTFICHLGTFCFRYMPFGLKSAPSTMSRVMAKIFKGENGKNCIIYLDDCICMSKGFEQHMVNLRVLFDRMRQYDLKLKPTKCFFAQKVSFLGHMISEEGIVPDPERTKSIEYFKTPKNVKEVRGFLGFCGFYRRFIKNFSSIARPLNELLKKNVPFKWGQPQKSAFHTLKEKVLSPPILCHYDPDATLILRTDSSTYGLGGHLVQASKDDHKSDRRLLACISRTLSPAERNYSISELECLSIVWSISKFRNYLYGRKFVIETDHHALCYLMKMKDPNGRLCRWSILLQGYDFDIYYNAGANHADADCLSRFPQPASFRDLDIEYLEDSVLQPSVLAFTGVENIPRQWGDAESTDTETELPNLAEEQRADPHLSAIIATIEGPVEHENQNHYVLYNNVLYRRSQNSEKVNYALCVPQNRIKDVLTVHHDCTTAGHVGRNKTYDRIKQNYYWKNMYKDVQQYVNTCKECQTFKPNNQKRPGLYQPLPVPEKPFRDIAMDLIGPIKKTKSGNKYILSIVCRLTKFAFACPLPDIRDLTVMKAFQDQFLFKYGICERLLTDRGTNLCSDYSEKLYRSYGIKHKTTTAGHPECNGQVENFNKFISTSVAIHSNVGKVDWDDCLADVVYAYNTSTNDSTQQTPYYLVFGVEPRKYLDNLFQLEDITDEPIEREKQIANLAIARVKARKEIEKSQQKNMQRVNKNRREVDFKVGDRVLLQMKHLKLSKDGKLKPKYSGPYVVLKRISPLTYRLTKAKGAYKSSIVHVKRLKLYKRRELESDKAKETSSGTDADEEDNRPDSETEIYWQDSSEREQEERVKPDRPRRNIRKPKTLKDFVCYLYRLIN